MHVWVCLFLCVCVCVCVCVCGSVGGCLREFLQYLELYCLKAVFFLQLLFEMDVVWGIVYYFSFLSLKTKKSLFPGKFSFSFVTNLKTWLAEKWEGLFFIPFCEWGIKSKIAFSDKFLSSLIRHRNNLVNWKWQRLQRKRWSQLCK